MSSQMIRSEQSAAPKKVLLIGSRGMLGKQLAPLLEAAGHTVLRASIDEPTRQIDITKLPSVDAVLTETSPDIVVNCAAYTAVDKAESEPTLALDVNGVGPRNLALTCRPRGTKIIHISTDYVYGGTRPHTPVKEGDPVSPCGVYGYSKYLGDEFLRTLYGEGSMILRTSWLHGTHGPNFVHTMLKLFKEKEELRVVNDQFGSPTWAGWLSRVIVRAVTNFEPGLFHASNAGATTWFQFATAIRDLSGSSCRVLPQSTEELNRPAPRPPYSVMNCSKLENLIGESCQSWEEGLKEHLASLNQ